VLVSAHIEGPLAGQVALVTGGSRGIGKAIVQVLAARGMSVAVVARRREDLDHATEELSGPLQERLTAYTCDVGNLTDVAKTVRCVVERAGRLDVVVNAAGVSAAADVPLELSDPREWEQIVRTNLTGTYNVCRQVIPHLARTCGQIVNVLSLGAYRVRAGSGLYSASKYGARALTEALAAEQGADGIRVASVSPGPVATSIWDLKEKPPSEDDLGLMLRPADVAEAVVWLLERPPHVYIPNVMIAPRRDPFVERPSREVERSKGRCP
jgi:NAD(P)-dependent dehydrogenase (short-subunit alcohol dehydrogenase family)